MLKRCVAWDIDGSRLSGKCGKPKPPATKLFILATKSSTDPGFSNSWTKKPVNNFYEKALFSTENFFCQKSAVLSLSFVLRRSRLATAQAGFGMGIPFSGGILPQPGRKDFD